MDLLEGTESLPVRVRIANAERASLSEIISLDLQPENNNQNGSSAPRSTDALGEFDLVPDLAKVSRRNERRVNIVQGFLTAGTLPSVVQLAFEEKLAEENFDLPPGYTTRPLQK